MPEVEDQNVNNLPLHAPCAALFQKDYGFIRMKVKLGNNGEKIVTFYRNIAHFSINQSGRVVLIDQGQAEQG